MARHRFHRRPRFARPTCSYYSCRRESVARCRYCGKYFCRDHLRPEAPSRPFRSVEEHSRYSETGGHPCPDYVENYERNKNRELGESRAAMDGLLASRPQKSFKPVEFREDYSPPRYSRPAPSGITFNVARRHTRTLWKIVKWLIIIGIVLLLAYFVYAYFGDRIAASFKPKPEYYCENGNTTCFDQLAAYTKSCTDSVFITDVPAYTARIEFTLSGSDCRMDETIEQAFVSQFNGQSMTCVVPLSKLSSVTGGLGSSLDGLKYCQGPLKDTTMNMLMNMFS